MAITKDNFIVVYQLGNLDSVDFAIYYATKHGMDTSSINPSGNTGSIGGISWEVNGQLLGIQLADTSEILSSEEDFNTQLLNPIKDAISNSGELGNLNIWGIVLGYNIPGGFYSGDDIISSTSRISRLNFSFSKKRQNKLYNRSIFQRIDATDAAYALICSRIDAPSLQAAKAYLDNAEKLNEQVFANGVFYIDQYSDRADTGASEYQEVLSDFNDNMLSSLNLGVWATTFMDPYIDSVIPFVENDSFVWSWFTDRAHSSFFRDTNALRVFFYNADYDGGFTIRDENGNRWPYLAMSEGYVSSAGAMSNPTIPGFLNQQVMVVNCFKDLQESLPLKVVENEGQFLERFSPGIMRIPESADIEQRVSGTSIPEILSVFPVLHYLSVNTSTKLQILDHVGRNALDKWSLNHVTFAMNLRCRLSCPVDLPCLHALIFSRCR